ncbi:hypothetical protein BSKO_12418 [Bryopsis sp. KO-2023]|nr:hypothetical protein BSKO_12418 [Bryopsis sp. KO-2023]
MEGVSRLQFCLSWQRDVLKEKQEELQYNQKMERVFQQDLSNFLESLLTSLARFKAAFPADAPRLRIVEKHLRNQSRTRKCEKEESYKAIIAAFQLVKTLVNGYEAGCLPAIVEEKEEDLSDSSTNSASSDSLMDAETNKDAHIETPEIEHEAEELKTGGEEPEEKEKEKEIQEHERAQEDEINEIKTMDDREASNEGGRSRMEQLMMRFSLLEARVDEIDGRLTSRIAELEEDLYLFIEGSDEEEKGNQQADVEIGEIIIGGEVDGQEPWKYCRVRGPRGKTAHENDSFRAEAFKGKGKGQ